MNLNTFIMSIRPLQLLKVAIASALALILVACGGGGTTPITDVTTTPSGLRTLSVDFIERKAVNYSPYRDSKTNEERPNEDVTDAEVLQDLTLVKAAGFGLIRLFDSDEKVAQRVLRVITDNKLDIKVYLGMWMAGNNDAGNKDQMARGVALANSYPNIVLAVSVGNESLVSWSGHKIPVEELAANIKTVREQIKQPVTTDDNWAYYAAADRAILDVIDFAAVHTYAMVDTHYLPDPWDWQQLGEKDLTKRAAAMMDESMVATKGDYQAVRTFLDSRGFTDMPIVIGETGWMNKDPGSGWYKFLAHPVNQKMYYDRLMAWANEGRAGAGPKNVFYFEAFDEPWKGSDDGWGLFNVDREARYALSDIPLANNTDLGNGAIWKLELPEATCTRPSGAQYTASEAIYYAYAQANLAISSTRYTLFADTITSGEARPTACDMWWDAFDGNSAVYQTNSPEFLPADAPNGLKVTPAPKDYGWGLLFHSRSGITENLSAFEASGRLNFSVKTDYIGKIKIGISTDTYDRAGAEAYVVLANGDNGYCNNGSWCNVSIPLSAFKAANPKIDFQYVLTRFTIADIYKDTGNTPGQTKVINLDSIYWSK